MAKSKLKTQKTTGSIGGFLKKLADPVQRADALVIVDLMKKATKVEPKMWGPAIIGFGDRVLKYPSGRELDWFKTGFSPRKGTLTLYIMNGFKRQDALLGKLGKHSTGGGCLYIKRLADVDLKVLSQMIADSVAHQAIA